MSGLSHSVLSNVILTRSRRSRIRDLKGFRRTHQLPSEFNDHTAAFVSRIAAADLAEDLDQRFSEFRRSLGFRRLEMSVTDPECGNALITTPWFDYRVSASLAEDSLSEVDWRWQLSEFRDPKHLQDERLQAAFGAFFDTVEYQPPEPLVLTDLIDHLEAQADARIALDYDRHATWCTLQIVGMGATVRVLSDRISMQFHSPPSPGRLLEAFLTVRVEITGRPAG